MKKLIIIAFAVFTVANCVESSNSKEAIDIIKSKHLRTIIRQKKDDIDAGLQALKKQCPGVNEKLKAAITSFEECDKQSDDSLTVCNAIQTYTLNCTRPLLKVVDDCLPQEAKGLPVFGAKSLISVAEFLCKQSGESIFELVNSCLWENIEESTELLQECDDNFVELKTKYRNKIPNKNEICIAAVNLRACILGRSAPCKNQKTKDIFTGIFNAAMAPCTQINELN